MKNIFKIHLSTYLFYLILIFSGYINYLVNYIIIITFHELGHILMIYILKYKIESIDIYPFGGIIKTNINYNINSNKLFLISISGILMQLLLFLLFNNKVFKFLNISLIIFNLLPVKPSDGSKMLESHLERFFSYKNTLVLTNIISIITLFSLFILTKNIFIFVVLYYLNIKIIMNIKYILNKFKIERYLYDINYSKIKYVNSENNLFKCRKNYIKWYNNYIEEKEYYKIKFSKYY